MANGAFPFIQTHDIVPLYPGRYDFDSDAAYSDESAFISMENCDHIAVLLNVPWTKGAGINKHIAFWACDEQHSEATRIDTIYFRQKVGDGSDSWGAVQTISDGMFDISDGGHCTTDEDSDTFLFEFDAVDIANADTADGSDARNTFYAIVTSEDDDGSDCIMTMNAILHPIRYSNGAATSYDNLT